MKRSSSGDDDFGNLVRRNIFFSVIALIGIAFIARLVQLQLIQGSEFRSNAEAQAIKQLIIQPVRGSMFDKNGRLAVHNAPSFSIAITPNEFKKETLPLLSRCLTMSPDEILATLEKYRVSKFRPVKILRDAPLHIVASVEESKHLLPGVDIISESKRLYEFNGNSAHLFGYIKEISERKLNILGDYYRPGDNTGETGLEESYEAFLRGEKGVSFAAVNSVGRFIANFNNGKNDESSEDGFDLGLGIDLGVQEFADSLMQEHRGAIVALDPRSGEIITFVSKPDFDLRLFSGRVPGRLYSAIANDSSRPMFNRAAQTRYPPGSTWKMFVTLAALDAGIIDTNFTISCGGSFQYGNRRAACHGAHGSVDIRKSIQVSCNVFYYKLGMKLGIDNFTHYGKMFGFGEKTGIDIGQENAGLLPSRKWFNKVYGEKKWNPEGIMINLGIGQGELGVTPLQMAVYTGVLANEGTWYQPHVVRSIYNHRLDKVLPNVYAKRDIPINKRYFEIIKEGMELVVSAGTARASRVDSLVVCGKTGTAQNPHGKDHAWYVCFAPKDNPQIAMCVMVENAGFGGAVAAPIAQKVLERYFFPHRFAPKDSTKSSTTATVKPVAATSPATQKRRL